MWMVAGWRALPPSRAAALGCVAVALSVAACGSSSKTTTSATAAANTSSAASGKHFTVGLASEGLNLPFPEAIANGVKQVATQDGVHAIVLDGKASETTQESDVQTLIAQHVNGIIIDPIDPGPTATLVKQARTANIPVMIVHGYAGSAPKPVYPGVAEEVNENETQAGVQAGQLALKAAPTGGQVAIITGTPGYNAVGLRENGFTSVTNPTAKYHVVATQTGNWIATGGYSACASILQAHPKISLFYTEADDMAIGCARAEKAVGSKAPIVSIGGALEVKSLIARHAVYGTVCYEPKTEGETVMAAMDKLLTGQAHPDGTLDFYNTPIVTAANLNGCGWQW